MLVLFVTLGWNVCLCCVVVCIWANLLSSLSRFLYLIRISLCSFLSIACWIYGQVFFHELAKDKCRRYICCFSCYFLTHCGRVTQICVFTLQLCRTGDRFAFLRYNCAGRVTQICVFNTVKLGTSASSP